MSSDSTVSQKLSIIIPVYNEERIIVPILNKIIGVKLINDLEKGIIIVNDYSYDKTVEKVKHFINTHEGTDIKYFNHKNNKGKGAALHTGIKKATGDFLLYKMLTWSTTLINIICS